MGRRSDSPPRKPNDLISLPPNSAVFLPADAINAPRSMESAIENMVSRTLSGILEQQTAKTIASLEAAMDRRIADISRSVQDAVDQCARTRASVQLCVQQCDKCQQSW